MALLAELIDITVVADCRSRDIAAGARARRLSQGSTKPILRIPGAIA